MKALTNNLFSVASYGQIAAKILTVKLLAGLCVFAAMLVTLDVYAQTQAQIKATQPSADSADVRINMNNAEIRSVIQWVAEKTNKNFIIDPRVKGRISVLSNQPMSMDQAYQVFLTALDVYGFAAVESGNNVKIIPNAQARSAGLPIVETFNNPEADNSELVLHVIKVNNISANEVVTILRPLVPQTGHLGAFPSSNSVIIADRANNINRLSKLVSYIDSTGDLDIEVIQLTHATADDVVSVLQPLLKTGKAASDVTGINFATDARSNSILMTGNEDKRALVRDLIDSLDRPLQGTGNTKVVFLNYIDADEIKPILDGMTGSISKDEKNVSLVDADINIQSSETNNALIITAPPSILESIETVITELDVKRSQVMIEAIIVEVTDSFSNTLEILWGTSPTLSGGVSSANLLGSTTSTLAVSDNPGAALVQSGLNWGFFRNGSLRSLLHAVASDNNNNVLSTPSIITIDNEEAEILVGSNVPFVTGSQTSAATSTNNPFRTIQREDIGITLKITPKVSKQRTITLAVEQEVESVREEQISAAQDLITDKRSIKTNVLVDDGTILVLGGLIEDRTTRNQTKVPLLGDIPLLGRFFSSDTKTTRKQNLMVFIKTTIIDDLSLAEKKTRESYNDIRDKQKGLGNRKEKLTLPDFESQKPADKAAVN
ncbi:MAG TPA: type II secretion system protein GspD [Cellvibrionales bacterium]|nr:type II secretion system protein GspD [Cellvibrionales bacterium]